MVMGGGCMTSWFRVSAGGRVVVNSSDILGSDVSKGQKI